MHISEEERAVLVAADDLISHRAAGEGGTRRTL